MSPRHRRTLSRLITATVLTGVALAAGAGVASAHVHVTPEDATAGSYTVLSFRVPNESATAGNTKIAITLPSDHPFASVSAKQTPGWTVTTTKTKLAAPVTQGKLSITEPVTTVTFTADGTAKLPPGQFATFDLSVGPVPDVKTMTLPVAQTYDDNTVVNWNEPTPASGEEPEHPAPTLTIGEAAAATDHHDTAAASGSAAPATTSALALTAAPTSSGSGSNGAAITLAVIGIVVGAAALLLGALAWRRPARSNQAAATPAA